MLVEAAWAAAKAPGPLHAFFLRIRARRGHRIAAVVLAPAHQRGRLPLGAWSPTRYEPWSCKPGCRQGRETSVARPTPIT
jgi:hypothetical protein